MMKCLLLLLASGLVTSDKLDRTYLPPPGAKYSGGTLDDLNLPLEYPKETVNNLLPAINTYNTFNGNLINGVPSLKEYPKLMVPNDIRQTTVFPSGEYQSTVGPSLQPVPSFYGNLAPKSPSSTYLPSKPSNVGLQTHSMFNPNIGTRNIPNINVFRPNVNQKENEYYYYVPTMQTYKNDITNVRPNVGLDILKNTGSPNQFLTAGNNGYLANSQKYIPTLSPVNDIAPNYQPSAFGYYGGNPMIMMTARNQLPQGFGNKNLIPKFGSNSYNNNIPQSVSTINQNTLKDTQKTTARPFLTPFVQLNKKKTPNFPDLKSTTLSPNTLPTQFSTTDTTDRAISNNNMPVIGKKIGIPIRPQFRPERPQAELERKAVIVNYENTITPEGYSYSYDTSNGIHADESGVATNGVRAKGSYSYPGDDGKIYTVTYTADENGFQPKGDHLPTPPPVPEAIKKIIEQAAKDKAAGIIDDGSYDEKKYGHMNYQGAMDRYNQFTKNSDNYSRFIDNKRKQSGSPQNVNNKKLDTPLSGNNDSKINRQSNKIQNDLQNLKNNENGIRSGFDKNNLNEAQFNKQNRRPITSVTNDQMTNGERETQNPDTKYKVANDSMPISYTNTKDQLMNQGRIPGAGVTLTDDGYYYVPPVIKFNPNTENPVSNQNVYLSTKEPMSNTIDTETNRRSGFDEPLRRNNINGGSPTEFPYNINTVATESTRKPYISGPVNQDKVDYNTQSKVPAENNKEKDVMYPNLPLYSGNTTPMASQPFQENLSPDQYSQYYQSTTTPTLFDQTQPNVIENRVNIPTGKPGITVSQDFVTTTYRPIISGDGVLEVNQNVKIYSLGKPETTSTDNGYVYNVPDYKENLYSTTAPNGIPSIPGYSDNFYAGPIQNSALFQGIPNEAMPNDNQYVTTVVPETISSIILDPYANINFSGVPQGDPGIPNIPFSNPNIFGTTPELTTPSVIAQNPEPIGRIIVGEDFTGPKQPQTFDPETGYYYK